ncbi:MAG: transglutaminase-like domain-containing protein [Bacteroidota bacterium]
MNEIYLQPAEFVNSDSEEIKEFTKKAIGSSTDPVEKAVKLYYAVRDGFNYNPYNIDLNREALKASTLLKKDYGYCVEKACLLAASARAAGIPSRLGFARVRNHIATEKLEEKLKTNVLVFHGFTEFFLNEKWVKATPAFNKSLCVKLNVDSLEFNGKDDSIFQSYGKEGAQFMEYLHDYGTFHDVPYELFVSELKTHYPHLFEGSSPELSLKIDVDN